MKNLLKVRGSGMLLIPTASLPEWAVLGGKARGLTQKITELLREQIQLLESTDVLSGGKLESYETRSEQIGALIRLLPEK